VFRRLKSFWTHVHDYFVGPTQAIWMAVLALLIADSLDILSSWYASRFVLLWQEANFVARSPMTHKFLLSAGIAMKAEAYVFFPIFLYLFYKTLRTALSDRMSALLTALPIWYLTCLSSIAALENIGFTVYWYGWMRHWVEALVMGLTGMNP
jgi:hypothetical protein